MNYQPLPDGFTIKESNIQGLGLFTTKKIKKGLIGVGWVKHGNFSDGYVRTPLGGFVNHSDEPNCNKMVHDSVGIMWLEAMRDINSNEEITVEYSLYKV